MGKFFLIFWKAWVFLIFLKFLSFLRFLNFLNFLLRVIRNNWRIWFFGRGLGDWKGLVRLVEFVVELIDFWSGLSEVLMWILSGKCVGRRGEEVKERLPFSFFHVVRMIFWTVSQFKLYLPQGIRTTNCGAGAAKQFKLWCGCGKTV